MSTLLERLRSLPTMVQLRPEQEKIYPFSLFSQGLSMGSLQGAPQGFPKTGLVELSGPLGSGKTEVIIRFLSENKNLNTVWLEKEFTFNPGVFCEYPIEQNRVLFLDLSSPYLKQSFFWCVAQTMKSNLFQVVVLTQLPWSEKDLRRLQLLAKEAGVLLFFIEREPRRLGTWSFSLQIQVRRSEAGSLPMLQVLKNRNFSASFAQSRDGG